MQNVKERMARIGPVAETLRRVQMERLKGYMEAFYEHGALEDVLLLSAAFEKAEQNYCSGQPRGRAYLVESLLMVSGVSPHQLSRLGRRNTRSLNG
jgi:hypothetical protein